MRVQSVVKVGAVLAAIAAVVVVGAIIAVKSVNLDQVKEVLTTQVKTATGRTLTIAGPLELNIGLVPSVVAKGVTLSNPAGSTRPEMVKIGKFEMEIALMPLFQREIIVNRLLLSSPDILIETDAKGPGNLDFSQPTDTSAPRAAEPKQPAAGGDNAFRFTINELKITAGVFAWHDRVSKKTESVEIEDLSLQPDRAAADLLAMRLLAKARGHKIDLTGTVGRPAAMVDGKPYPLKLKAQIEGLALTVDGTIAELAAFRGLKLKVSAQGGELSEAMRLAGVTPPELPQSIGPFTVAGVLTDSNKQLSLTDVVVEAGKADLVQLGAKGTVKDLTGTAGVDLAVNVASDNPAAAAKAVGAEFSGQGPVKLAGQLQGSDKTWKMAGFKASVGASDLSGDLTAHLGPRPKISGKLVSATINPADFAAPAATAASGKSTPQPGREKGGDGRVFPNTPLPVAALRALDADLGVQVGKLVLDDQQLSDVALTVALNGGRLAIKPFRFGLAGGVVEGEANLDAAGKTPAVALRLQGRQVEIGKLAGKGPIIGGKSDLKADLKGSGDSVRAIMASATGETSVGVGEGKLRNKAVDLAAGDLLFQVLGALNPFAKSEDTTQMTCAAVRFVIRDGVATADKGIAMRTNQVDVVGSGTVDLRSEELDLGIKPRARGGVGLSLSSPLAGLVKVGGTIAKPSIGIDAAGTLKTAASVGAGVATGGLSVVGEMLIDKVTADEDPCRTALGLAQQSQAKPKTETKKQSSGGLLKGIFGR